jgi:hypothetical protein
MSLNFDSNDARILALQAARPSRPVPAFRFIGFLFRHCGAFRISCLGLIEKLTHFPQHLVEYRCVHLSNRVKNDPTINGEKSLWTNEALMRELSAFKIATIQRNGESIVVRAARDLAENQILAWKIVDYESRPALSAGGIGPRKTYDNDFAGYRFDHAASSSGEFQSSARTDSLSSAPLNASSRAFLFRRIVNS